MSERLDALKESLRASQELGSGKMRSLAYAQSAYDDLVNAFFAPENLPVPPTGIVGPIVAPMVVSDTHPVDAATVQAQFWFDKAGKSLYFYDGDDWIRLTGVVSAAAPAPGLPAVKARKLAGIDHRTGQLIAQGFEFPASSGTIFSLSRPAQLKLIGLHTIDPAKVTWPVSWNTKDDAGSANIAEVDAVLFFETAFGTIKTHLDSGTTLKDSVRAATDEAGVDAVVDTR